MPQNSVKQCKKNLQGGKAHKGQANKERAGPRKNRELTTSYVDEIILGNTVDGITLARVNRVHGGARMELFTMKGDTITAGLKGSLKCSKGAARRSDNPLAAFTGSYVLLQESDYGFQIAGILSGSDVRALQPHLDAPKGFFSAEAEDDCGIEWDNEEDEVDVDAI